MMPILSRRSSRLQPQPMFRILAQANELERAGRPIVRLEIGDTSHFADPELQRLLREDKRTTASLGYSPSAGEPELREVLARQYASECGVPFTRENVVITPANAAISQLLAVLCDEGDRVLLPDPAFPTYQLAVRFNGLAPVFFPLREKSGFAPNLAEIQALVEGDQRIRAVVIDNPSNPLGVCHDVEVMDKLAALCAEHNLALVIDDTYKNLVYTDAVRRIRHLPSNFYIYSLSKDAGAPALRIGCVVGDAAVVAKVADYNSLFYSCLPKPLQMVAAIYLEGERKQLKVLRRAIVDRIQMTISILGLSPWLSFVRPNAAIYVYVNIVRTGLDSDAFADRLLLERGVCVCPGTGFGPSGRDYIRICLSGKEADLSAGCREIVDFAELLATEMQAKRNEAAGIRG